MPARKSKKHHHKENNKLLVLLLIFLSFVLAVVYLSTGSGNKYSFDDMKKDVNSADVFIPDASVSAKLTDGKADFDIEGSTGFVEVAPPYFSYKTNGKTDIFAVMTYNTGGSGEFVNIAHFRKTDEGLAFITSYAVGDRVIVNDIKKGSDTLTGYEINVSYLDRKPNEPMNNAPMVKSNIFFPIKVH